MSLCVTSCIVLVACTAPQKKFDLYEMRPITSSRPIDNDVYYVAPIISSHCFDSINDSPSCGGI